MLHIGLDEAGYGPLLGPLVIGLSATRIPGSFPRSDPLRRRLTGLVCRPQPRERYEPALPVPLDDSKVLYRRFGRDGLARAVGAFAAAMDHAPPANLYDWILRFSDVDPESFGCAPWFGDLHTVPVPGYAWTGPLEPAFRERGVQALDLRVLPVDAGALNTAFHRWNKARVLGIHTGTLLLGVLNRYPDEDADVWIDRHGGRRDYEDLLAEWFAFAAIRCVCREAHESRYYVQLPGRTIRLRFRTAADAHMLSVSWASVAAKFTRELFMQRFNTWFRIHCPTVRPTAGYYEDGRRFLGDVEGVVRSQSLDRALLVRDR